MSITRTIFPLPGPFPSEPSISTPTKTSPVGAAQRHAGQGVICGPESIVDLSSEGKSADLTLKANSVRTVLTVRNVLE